MTADWTDFHMEDIPQRTREILAARARKQIVERYGAPARLFERAEAMVEAGHVVLTMRNTGLVYDAEGQRLGGGWLAVSSDYCAHCDDSAAPALCVHKLAIWYADLLSRHLPESTQVLPEEKGRTRSAESRPQGTTGAARGTLGRYHGSPPPRRRTGRTNDGRHCPLCGAWLTADGTCNKCGGV